MESSELKRIISDQREQNTAKLASGKIVPRERISCEPKIDLATVVTGPRRAGKSTFCLLSVKGKPHAYINFDDERIRLKASGLNEIAEAFLSLYPEAQTWIFDEIQNIPGWELFVSRIVQNKKIIITGSNSNLLSGELATHLTGRHSDIRVFPFSFREYLQYRNHAVNLNLTTSIAATKSYLERFISEGGYPLAYKSDTTFYLTLYSDIIQKDILARYEPRRQQELKDLAKLLVSNSGMEISFSKLKNAIGVDSVSTVKKYVSYIENAFLVFTLKRFSFKLKEQLMAPRKVYCIDTGFVSAVAPPSSSGKGRLMETLVAVELLRRTTWKPGSEFCYWKDYTGKEVDFVQLENGKPKQLIQVCYDASNPLTMQRELDALRKGMKELKTKNGIVITWDQEKNASEKKEGIQFIPLWKWLIETRTTELNLHKKL